MFRPVSRVYPLFCLVYGCRVYMPVGLYIAIFALKTAAVSTAMLYVGPEAVHITAIVTVLLLSCIYPISACDRGCRVNNPFCVDDTAAVHVTIFEFFT